MSFLRRFTKRPPPPAKEPDDEPPKDDAPRKSRFTLFGSKKKDDAAPKKRKSWFGGGKKDKEDPEPRTRPPSPSPSTAAAPKKEKSTTKKRCLDPYYGERFALPLDGGDESVKCTVFDEDVVSSHDFMGVADIPCAPLADRRPTKRWYKLLGKKGDASKDLGEIQLTLHWVHDPSRLLELPLCEPGKTKNELVVALRRARHLRALDRNLLTENSSDPFAILRCDGEEAKSKVVYNTCDPASSDGSATPVWDEILTVRVDDGAAPVCLELRDKDVLSSDLLGFADAFAAERGRRGGAARRPATMFERV
ncbi:hypothetical protein JL721_4413 [Aureococcus anophagefferens]|nr:hypothetical protein JL721_4413 [Aureococcus anophagefferens]